MAKRCDEQLLEHLKSIGRFMVDYGKRFKKSLAPQRHVLMNRYPEPHRYFDYIMELFLISEKVFEHIDTYNRDWHKCALCNTTMKGAFGRQRLIMHYTLYHDNRTGIDGMVWPSWFHRLQSECAYYIETHFKSLAPDARDIFMFYREQDNNIEGYYEQMAEVITGRFFVVHSEGSVYYDKLYNGAGKRELATYYMKYMTMIGEFFYAALPKYYVDAIGASECTLCAPGTLFFGARYVERAINHVALFHPERVNDAEDILQETLKCACKKGTCRTLRCTCYKNRKFCYGCLCQHCNNCYCDHTDFGLGAASAHPEDYGPPTKPPSETDESSIAGSSVRCPATPGTSSDVACYDVPESRVSSEADENIVWYDHDPNPPPHRTEQISWSEIDGDPPAPAPIPAPPTETPEEEEHSIGGGKEFDE